MRAVARIDLRLVPAAVCAWITAAIALAMQTQQILILALSCAGIAFVLLCGLGLAAWVVSPGDTGAAQRADNQHKVRLHKADSRRIQWQQVGIHVLLCAIVASAVSGSAWITAQGEENSVWPAVLEDPRPVELRFRVQEDLQVSQKNDNGSQLYGRVTISEATPASAGQPSPVRTSATILMDHPDSEDGEEGEPQQSDSAVSSINSDAGLIPAAGQEYTGTFRVSPSDRGFNVSALIVPWGEAEFEEEPRDGYARLMTVFNGMRKATVELSQIAPGEGRDLLPGVVLGDRSQQGPELTEAMQVAGLTHMTVVSGTHCSLVLGALMGLLRVFRAPRWATLPATLIALVLFVMLVQPAPSVIRAAVMGSIGALAVFAGRGRASSSLLCVCVIVLLLISPWFAYDAAFQLSVSATLGIVLIGNPLKHLLQSWMPEWFAAALALAISAQIFVTPVLLPIAEGVTLYSIIANIIAGPLLPLATVPGTIGAVISVIAPWASSALFFFAGCAAALIGAIGYVTTALPHALVPWPEGTMGWIAALCYCVATIWIALLFVYRKTPRFLDIVVSSALLIFVTVAVVAENAYVQPRATSSEWHLALCDVGQGDMVLIRSAENSAILIDAGEEPELAAECIHRLGITHVDVAMLTHEHADHVQGFEGVLQHATVDRVLYSGSTDWHPQDSLDEDLTDVAVERATVGDTGSVNSATHAIEWDVISAAEHFANPNDNSKVTVLRWWDPKMPEGSHGSVNDPVSLLSTGDMEEQLARLLLSQQRLPHSVDIVKLSHHGAANGGSEIITAMDPSIGLIGVGEDNSYGHPDQGIIDTLESIDASVFRTDHHGTLVFEFLNGEMAVEKIN